MADWGFLSGLSGRKNWDAIDAQKNKELQYQFLIDNIHKQKLEDTQKHIAEIQDLYAKGNNIEATEPDLERIRGVSNKLKENIKEKIKNYGGDFEKYMQVEGMADGKNYANALINDPVTIKAMHNSKSIALHNADVAAGLMPRIDPSTGKSYNEYYSDFYAGKRDDIPYYGAFKPGKFDAVKHFSEKYYNEQKTPHSATPEEFLSEGLSSLTGEGVAPQDALQQLRPQYELYKDQYQKGNKLQYKSEKQPSEIDTKLKLERYELERDRHIKNIQQNSSDSWEAFNSGNYPMGVNKAPDGTDIYPSHIVDANSYNKMMGLPTDEKNIGQTTTAGIANTPYSEPAKKAMAGIVFGLSPTSGQEKKEKGAGFTGAMLNGNELYSAVNLQKLKGNINDYPDEFVVKDISNSSVIKSPPGSGKPDKHMALMHIDMTRELADKLGIWQHNTIFPDRANKASEGSGRQGATTEGKLGRVFSVYVDIDNVPIPLRESFTKKIQFGSLSNQDIEQYMNEEKEPVSSDEETQ